MEFKNPEGWPRPPGFSQAATGAGRQVHIAGQIGVNPITHEMRLATLLKKPARRWKTSSLRSMLAVRAQTRFNRLTGT